MARYQGHVDVFRATIPLGVHDRQAAAGEELRRRAGLPEAEGARPAAVAGLRRRDVPAPRHRRHRRPPADAGREPSSSSPTSRPNKRDKLDRPAARQHRLRRLLRQQVGRRSCATSGGPDAEKRSTFAFHDWIRDSLHENKPYDQFVREILTATGDAGAEPAGRLVSRGEGRRRRSSKTRPSSSSACEFNAPAATTIRSRSGASRTTTASRRSSPRSAARPG